ncbi:hypothetical protein D9613_005278 [Agrocybe pediades]|uniref:SCP domain-containing protein n=1 Tax=Agrocybe pediades TaxID=84607 RepID=A0A8H4VTL8_9AGAR|nr:hypothetical protein D9613_005278 [Agrocybe pediades]
MFIFELFYVLALALSFGPQFYVHAYPASLKHAPASSIHSRGTRRQADAFLNAHNAIRTLHNATALTWSDDLAQKAESWADRCEFKHSNGVLSDQLYGENIVAGTGVFPISAAVATFVQDQGFEMETNMTLPIHLTCILPKWSGSRPQNSAAPSLVVQDFLITLSDLHHSTFVYTTLWAMLSGKLLKTLRFNTSPLSLPFSLRPALSTETSTFSFDFARCKAGCRTTVSQFTAQRQAPPSLLTLP